MPYTQKVLIKCKTFDYSTLKRLRTLWYVCFCSRNKIATLFAIYNFLCVGYFTKWFNSLNHCHLPSTFQDLPHKLYKPSFMINLSVSSNIILLWCVFFSIKFHIDVCGWASFSTYAECPSIRFSVLVASTWICWMLVNVVLCLGLNVEALQKSTCCANLIS